MDRKEFWEIYLPALEKALDNDHIRYENDDHYHVQDYSYYLDETQLREIEVFIENELWHHPLITLVTAYFDAVSGGQDWIGKEATYVCRRQIQERMNEMRTLYRLK